MEFIYITSFLNNIHNILHELNYNPNHDKYDDFNDLLSKQLSYFKSEMVINATKLQKIEVDDYIDAVECKFDELRPYIVDSEFLDFLDSNKIPYNNSKLDFKNFIKILEDNTFDFENQFPNTLDIEPAEFYKMYVLHITFYYYNKAETIFKKKMEGRMIRLDKFSRFKTKFTVPELSYLFRIIIETNKFEIKGIERKYEFIASNFETKGSSFLSKDSVGISYREKPSKEEMNNIKIQFQQMVIAVQKDIENFGA